MSKELLKQVDNHIKRLRRIAKKEYGVTVPDFKVKINIRGTNLYGEADCENKIMRLHKALLLECGDKYLYDTVTHEFVHFLIDALHPKDIHSKSGKKVSAHGKEFYEVFGTLGGIECKNYNDTEYVKNLYAKRKENQKLKELLEEVPYENTFGTYGFKSNFTKRQTDEIIYRIEQLCEDVTFPIGEKVIDSQDRVFGENEIDCLIKSLKNKKEVDSKYFILVYDEVVNVLNICEEYTFMREVEKKLLISQIPIKGKRLT